MLIFGIDPGTIVTGYGLIEKRRSGLACIDFGEIKPKKDQTFSGRLEFIYGRLLEIMKETRPEAVSLEDIFYGKNVKSLIKQGHVRGAIILAASHAGVPVFEYSPLEVKKAVVGYGVAEKRQVQQMVRAILKLPETPPPDASDALAIAICHSNFLKAVPL
jgi:crossover junction endodeoxyribonuclease RuvC